MLTWFDGNLIHSVSKENELCYTKCASNSSRPDLSPKSLDLCELDLTEDLEITCEYCKRG